MLTSVHASSVCLGVVVGARISRLDQEAFELLGTKSCSDTDTNLSPLWKTASLLELASVRVFVLIEPEVPLPFPSMTEAENDKILLPGAWWRMAKDASEDLPYLSEGTRAVCC